VITAKRAIMKAFRNQVDRKGFSFVEALSLCPTDWGMTSLQAAEWVRNSMIKHYPLGVYKDTGTGPGPRVRKTRILHSHVPGRHDSGIRRAGGAGWSGNFLPTRACSKESM